MRILLSNDDGYQARGIRVLAKELATMAEVTVVAPDRNRSGASNSLTLEVPLRVQETDTGVYYVNGTPTDCVHLAVTGLFDPEPDMIVSGINHGANLGDDVIYSGTVAAAVEGRFLGLPALAVSLVMESGQHFATAARVTRELIAYMMAQPVSPNTIFNVNVPDIPYEELQGYEITRLGDRHRSEPVIRARDPKQQPIYWIGAAGLEQDAGPGTDFHAIANNRVSISPLKIDLTDSRAIPVLSDWLKGLS